MRRFLERFPDEEAARIYLEELRWGCGVSCSHCGGNSVAAIKNQDPMPYRCRTCRQHFSVRNGTVLADSRISLRTWLHAIYILTSASTAIEVDEMAKILGISRKSTVHLARRIHETYRQEKAACPHEKLVCTQNDIVNDTRTAREGNASLKRPRGTHGLENSMSKYERDSAFSNRSKKLKANSRKEKINA